MSRRTVVHTLPKKHTLEGTESRRLCYFRTRHYYRTKRYFHMMCCCRRNNFPHNFVGIGIRNSHSWLAALLCKGCTHTDCMSSTIAEDIGIEDIVAEDNRSVDFGMADNMRL